MFFHLYFLEIMWNIPKNKSIIFHWSGVQTVQGFLCSFQSHLQMVNMDWLYLLLCFCFVSVKDPWYAYQNAPVFESFNKRLYICHLFCGSFVQCWTYVNILQFFWTCNSFLFLRKKSFVIFSLENKKKKKTSKVCINKMAGFFFSIIVHF